MAISPRNLHTLTFLLVFSFLFLHYSAGFPAGFEHGAGAVPQNLVGGLSQTWGRKIPAQEFIL